MKALSLIATIAIFAPAMSFAATFCQGVSYKHTFTVAQKQNDVEVTLDDEKLIKYSDLKHTNEGTLKISGRNVTTVVVSNITVDDFLAKKALNRQLAVSMMAGRPEYEGEEDMWFAYAGDLYAALKCQ